MEGNNETTKGIPVSDKNGETGGKKSSYESSLFVALTLDPIHVGAGGGRLGRVDNEIVRDPATRLPKIPGSSLAGVMRAYVAMAKGKYPACAGLGQAITKGAMEHCREKDCPVCSVFGYAKGGEGGFAGLVGFSDMQILLFPVASQQGPQWLTSPLALRLLLEAEDREGKREEEDKRGTLQPTGAPLVLADYANKEALYLKEEGIKGLNLGWLFLPVEKNKHYDTLVAMLGKRGVPEYITGKLGVVSDKLFSYIVNSNLEVRTSVAISPATGAAEDKALFTYEALPRGTLLVWEEIYRNPEHFRVGGAKGKGGEKVEVVKSPQEVGEMVALAHPYLEYLGIGGMGTRGMGRLKVLDAQSAVNGQEKKEEVQP